MNTQGRSLAARDWLGSAAMLSFTLIAVQRWDSTGSIFFLLLAADNLVKSFFFYTRSEATVRGGAIQSLVAYASAALPLFYMPATDDVGTLAATSAQLLMIGGFLLVALATIDLGPHLGLSPAKRGQAVQSGVYKSLRHPMYWGHIIAECGLLLANPVNTLTFLSSVLLYRLRMSWEDKFFKQKYQ